MNKDKTVALYQAIADSNEERIYSMWHASSIYECPRAHYLKRQGKKSLSKPGAGKVLRWQAGHHAETALREYIKKVWGEVQSNERLTSDNLQLTGEYDNLTMRGDTLIEIKTVHDYAFIERDGNVYLKDEIVGAKGPRGGKVYEPKNEPYPHHQWQNHSYALLLDELKSITVKNIDYVYSSLSGRLCVYSTKVDPSIMFSVKERLELLNNAWKTQTAPECLCREGLPFWKESNQWCQYKNGDKCCEL